MKHAKYILIILLSFLCLNTVIAQSVLRGKVVDTKSGKGIDMADVVLMKDANIIVAKVNTNAEGEYRFDEVRYGTYRISVSSFGMPRYVSEDFEVNLQEVRLPEVTLSAEVQLDGVTVVGEKQTIQLEADKKVFNVDKSLMSDAGTAQDILNQIPSVTVDNDGEVSLRGKSNVTILINGKQTNMFGTSNADIVQQLPAGSIDKIEVMTNPSSKYDAQGMGGIINIQLKQTQTKSEQGTVTLGAGTGDRYNGSLNYNINRNRTKFAVNLNGRNNNNDDYFKSRRTVSDPYNSIYTEGDHEKRRARSFLNFTLEQGLRQKDVLTVGVTGFYNYIQNHEVNDVKYYSQNGQVDSSIHRVMPFNVNPHAYGFELGYKWHIDPKQSLSFSSNYNNFRAKRNQEFYTSKYDLNSTQIGVDTTQEVRGRGNFINGIAQLDYAYDVSENFKWELGAKNQSQRFISASDAVKKYDGNEDFDSVLTNSFDYDQKFYAGYTNLKKNWNKWSTQLGLRYEYFRYEGKSMWYESPITVAYNNLFPSAFVSYEQNEKSIWQLNYSRRVNRPSFFELFPYVNISDPLNIRVGNPELEPEFVHITELTYNRKWENHNLLATIYDQYTTNLIQRIYTFNDDGSSVLKPFNLNSSNTYGLDLTHIWTFKKMGDWTLSFNIFDTQIDGKNLDSYIGNQGMSWFAKSLFNYSLWKKLKLQWTINYLAKAYLSQGVREPQYWTDLAFRYSILDDKFSFTLNANDIFNTNRTVTVIDNPAVGLYQKIDRKPNSQYLQFSVTWNFINRNGGDHGRRGGRDGGSQPLKDRNKNFDPGGGGSDEG